MLSRRCLALPSLSTPFRLFNQKIFTQQDIEREQREVMETDFLIIGGGPAGKTSISKLGLSAALRFSQLNKQYGKDYSITLLEKGGEIGNHILSGNCFEPSALNELVPNWKELGAPLNTEVKKEEFTLLSKDGSLNIPTSLLPKQTHNKGEGELKHIGNYLISLGELCKWLASQCEEGGVDIFPGFAGDGFYLEDEAVNGVVTKAVGYDKQGEKTQNFDPGMLIKAKQTLLGEGCRGSLSEFAMKYYSLRKPQQFQEYGIGLKEVWKIDTTKNQHFEEGLVKHTVGWPLGNENYGGSFMYMMNGDQIHLGLVVGLGYKNPYLNPYEEFQRLKTHPDMKKYFEHGECISYGARCLNEGGFYAIPELVFPGGALIGCSAGFLDVPKIKGSHNAMETGLLAAQAIFEAVNSGYDVTGKKIVSYEEKVKTSRVYKELQQSRNFKGGFDDGLYLGLVHGFLTTKFTKGKEPWSFKPEKRDSEKTARKEYYEPIEYPPHDGQLTFDLLSNLQRSGTNHNHDQPSHLVVKESKDPLKSLLEYAGPEERFCPAKVYQFVEVSEDEKKLQINAQNCLHCKCCSIKMVDEYIDWNVPEGGGGPAYAGM